jgi:hypothetical protein
MKYSTYKSLWHEIKNKIATAHAKALITQQPVAQITIDGQEMIADKSEQVFVCGVLARLAVHTASF